MKALKVFFVLMFVLNVGVAFAEGEVASDCSQINDGTSRSGDRPAGETATPATETAVGA